MPPGTRDHPATAVRFRIEVPRGGRVKWRHDGRIAFVSPFRCPFNYGSALDHRGQDGDPADVVVLGAALERGAEAMLPVVARVRFEDRGIADDKWVLAGGEPTAAEWSELETFFVRYAFLKRLLGLGRGTKPTVFYGVEPAEHIEAAVEVGLHS